MTVAAFAVMACELYALTGLVFAIAFLPRGILRVDERLRGSPWAVRLLILPGVAALWPMFASRWLRHAPEPTEHNAHRAAARR